MVGHRKASPAENCRKRRRVCISNIELSNERETDEESKLSKTKFCNAVWRSPHSSFASQNTPSPLEKANLSVSLGDRGGGWLNRLLR